MKFSVVTHINHKPCRSLWQTKNTCDLPQLTRVQDFVRSRQIQSVAYISQNQSPSMHDMHVLTINTDSISLQQLCQTVSQVAANTRCYLWISVNKFLVYTHTVANYHENLTNWDLRLLKVLEDQLPGWHALNKYYDSEDHGNLGNFQYPVTALVLEKND